MKIRIFWEDKEEEIIESEVLPPKGSHISIGDREQWEVVATLVDYNEEVSVTVFAEKPTLLVFY